MFSYARVRGRLAALLAVGVTATTISATAPTAWAVDVVAPRLDSITFTSPSDVRPGDPVTISYAVTDASPTVSVVASFLDGAQRRTEWDFGRDLPLGGSASTTVPDGIANTTASLYEVTVTDAAGNRATYGQSGVVCVPDCPYVAVPLSHSLVVAGSTPDTAAPVLTSVAVPSVTAAAGQVARLEIDVDDAHPPVGPQESAVQAVFTNGQQLFALSADPTDRGAAVGVVPTTVPNGTYWLSHVVLRDLAGNASTYLRSGAVQVSPAGTSGPTTHTLPFAATTITVTGSTADYAPPALTSVGSPQKYFVAGSTGTLSYTATEEFLQSVTVSYSTSWAPDDAPISWDLVTKPTTSGLASGPVPTGTANNWYVSSIVLRDKAGNWSEYDRAGHLTCNRSCPASHTIDLAALDRTVVTVPTAPSWTGATGLSGSARVQWNPPDSDGWSAVTAYVVTVSPGGKTSTVAASARSLTVPGLANDVVYSFSVRARNAAGLGPAKVVKATPRPQRRLFLTRDVSNDGRADIIGVTRGNVAYIYRGNGVGGISGGTRVGGSLGDLRTLLPALARPNDDFFGGNLLAVTYSGYDEAWRAYNGNRLAPMNSISLSKFNAYRQVVTPGDFNGNTRADVLTIADNGDMYLWVNKDWTHFYSPKKIGSGWQSYPLVVGVGDLDGDRRNDLVARRTDGTLWLYSGNGAGGFRSRKQIGTSTGWKGYTQLAGMADLTGDGRADLLALAPNGYLYVYKGNGRGGFDTNRVRVSTGFGAFV